MKPTLVDLIHISKGFDGQLVLDDLNLSIHENEFAWSKRLRQNHNSTYTGWF